MVWVDTLNPVILTIGPLAIHWYGVMYAAGLMFGYVWIKRQITAGRLALTLDDLDALLVAIFLGVVVGGRAGHFIFYDSARLLTDPLALFRVWEGGMSFHGGLLGVVIALIVFARRTRMHPLTLSDAILVPVALGLALGRLGNFINGELWGVPTGGAHSMYSGQTGQGPVWGVIFPRAGDAMPRHPAQLYAMAKDILIFGVLQLLWGKQLRRGVVTFSFLTLYGLLRTIVEIFWRAPLDGFLFGLPVGAVYSLPLIVVGVVGLGWVLRRVKE